MNNASVRVVLKELTGLQKEPIEDIVLLPSEEGATGVVEFVLHGSLGTPYEGGQFKVRLVIGADYPASPPKGFFLTKIFHPNVSRAGDICVNTLKKDWSDRLGMRHVMLTIRCLLIQPNAESALNEEAGKLLLEDYDEYAKQAKLMTQIHASKQLVAAAQDENAGKTEGKATAAGEAKKEKTMPAASTTAATAAAKKKTLKRL